MAEKKLSEAEEYRQREREAADAMQLTTICAFCDWSYEGTAVEARSRALKHRAKKHPEIASKPRTKRRIRSLSSFRYAQMTDEDKADIERERRKRAMLHGVVIDE